MFFLSCAKSEDCEPTSDGKGIVVKTSPSFVTEGTCSSCTSGAEKYR